MTSNTLISILGYGILCASIYLNNIPIAIYGGATIIISAIWSLKDDN
jgi:hypothetical protein